jgi:hypothetical protein
VTGECLDQLIASIGTMSLEELRPLWGRHCGPPPTLRSVPIMRMVLAWRVQSDALGGLGESTRRMLSRSGAPEPEGKHLGVGARLTRQWQGG